MVSVDPTPTPDNRDQEPRATFENPFEGLQRLRLPGMHMITAREGGVPVEEAVASCLFTMFYDRLEMKFVSAEIMDELANTPVRAGNPDQVTLGLLTKMMTQSSIAGEEWSYISDEQAAPFIDYATKAIEYIQREMAHGRFVPGGRLLANWVERTDEWAERYPLAPDAVGNEEIYTTLAKDFYDVVKTMLKKPHTDKHGSVLEYGDLTPDQQSPFQIFTGSIPEQVIRWLADETASPILDSDTGTPYLQITQAATKLFGKYDHEEKRRYVQGLREEIAAGSK